MDETPKKGPELSSLVVDLSESASSTLVAAVTGKRVIVYGYELQSVRPCYLALMSLATIITGPVHVGAYGTVNRPVQAEPYCQTERGEALVLSRGSARVTGQIYYRQE